VTIVWCWSNERAPHLRAPGALFGDRAGSNSLMIGQTLWLEFFTNKDWPVASAAAVVLLVLLLAPLLLYERMQRRQLEAR
jgi:ABC-type spermidine/putrescine transport system permease subunit I